MLYNNQSLIRLESRPFDLYRKRYARFLSESREELLKEYYLEYTGELLDIENPCSYNEKLQWLKLFWYDKDATQYTDKYEVKGIVSSLIEGLGIIPTIDCYSSADEVDVSSLPDKCLIKATHGSGFNLFVTNKYELDNARVREVFRKILNVNYGTVKLEWNYLNVRPRLLVEPLIQCMGPWPIDYKFYCFHGEVKFVEVLNACDWHFNSEPMEMIVDRAFNHLNFSYSFKNGLFISKPPFFERMVEIAEYISQKFPHVRVDLYNFGDDQIYWGECTFFPSAGYGSFSPMEINKQVGTFLDLSKVPKVV